MHWFRRLAWLLVVALSGVLITLAEEAGGWRLELLKWKGFSSDTPALEDFLKGLEFTDESPGGVGF